MIKNLSDRCRETELSKKNNRHYRRWQKFYFQCKSFARQINFKNFFLRVRNFFYRKYFWFVEKNCSGGIFMKAIFLNGSPRKNLNSAKLLENLQRWRKWKSSDFAAQTCENCDNLHDELSWRLDGKI